MGADLSSPLPLISIPLSPEHHVRAVSQCLDAREFSQGFCHLALLLSYDPDHPVWLAFLHSFARAAGPRVVADYIQDTKALSKAPLFENALKAYLALSTLNMSDPNQEKAREDIDDSILRLINVHQKIPSSRYHEAWILPHLEEYEKRNSNKQSTKNNGTVNMASSTAAKLVTFVFSAYPDSTNCTARQKRTAKRWYQVLSKYQSDLEAQNFPSIGMIFNAFQRKAGHLQEAKTQAIEALKRDPSSIQALVKLSSILRDLKDYDSIEDTYRRMIQVRGPSYQPAFLDAGDTFLEAKMWAKAAEWYQGLLATLPDHPWALPSFYYCQFMMTGEDHWILKTLHLAERIRPTNQRAAMLLQRVITKPSIPMDTTAQMLGQTCMAWEQNHEPLDDENECIKYHVKYLDAPSNSLAIQLELEARGEGFQARWGGISVAMVASPDPRLQKKNDVRHVLWIYDNMKGIPALPPPQEYIREKILSLASMDYDPQKVWVAASYVAEDVGPEAILDLLGCLLHPPPMPTSGTVSMLWLPRVQSAATSVIAQLDPDSIWEASVRRSALYSMLMGPTDWITKEAITAVTELAQCDALVARDALKWFRVLEQCLPQERAYCCYEQVLYESWLRLPNMSAAKKKELKVKFARHQEQSTMSRQGNSHN